MRLHRTSCAPQHRTAFASVVHGCCIDAACSFELLILPACSGLTAKCLSGAVSATLITTYGTSAERGAGFPPPVARKHSPSGRCAPNSPVRCKQTPHAQILALACQPVSSTRATLSMRDCRNAAGISPRPQFPKLGLARLVALGWPSKNVASRRPDGAAFMERSESVATGRGKPLHLVLVGARAIAQEFSDSAIQPSQRIRILPFLFKLQLIALRVPTGPAAEVAGMIQREHCGFFKGRREKRRSGVSQVMLHDSNLGSRE